MGMGQSNPQNNGGYRTDIVRISYRYRTDTVLRGYRTDIVRTYGGRTGDVQGMYGGYTARYRTDTVRISRKPSLWRRVVGARCHNGLSCV